MKVSTKSISSAVRGNYTNVMLIDEEKDLDAGTFFSGLIDNVCIYNQTLSIGRIEALVQ